MAGGYESPPVGNWGSLLTVLDRMQREIAEIGRPTGTQTAGALEKLRQLIDDLPAQIYAVLATAVNTGSVNATGSVSAGGSVTAAGTVTGAAGMKSTGVYNTILTYGGGYKVQYVHVDGTMGYVPSSRQFKQDIEPAKIDSSVISKLRVVTYRYINAVENLGDDAVQEIGLIAEEVDQLGLHWLVDYDEGGKPFGVRYERIAVLLIEWAQSIEARLDAVGI